ncbi:hypothetical protein BJX64DRAFT_285374 [Aspergillus heterothallicus]
MEALHTLLGSGVGVNIRSAWERNKSITALELAVTIEDVELMELFLASGACPRHTGSGSTGCALVWAVQHCNERMASLVIRGSRCMQKMMALAFATEQEAGQMARFLLAHRTHPDFDDLKDSNAHHPKGYSAVTSEKQWGKYTSARPRAKAQFHQVYSSSCEMAAYT